MDSTLACLETWMPQQRWYATKGRAPALRIVGSWDLPDPHRLEGEAAAQARTLLVADEGAQPATLYQVPVVIRPTSAVDPASAHVIGSPAPGATLVDGPFDPAYTEALLRLVTGGGRSAPPDDRAREAGASASARGIPSASARATGAYTARVLDGEQSNTSIIYRGDDESAPIICKVFRQLHPGVNPDIELQTALAEAGSAHVPRAVGHVAGRWPDPSGEGLVDGSLAFAQEFVPGVEDAWRVALRAAAAGEAFDASARGLGVATAEVHVALADLFDAVPAAEEDRARISDAWRRRLSAAIAESPEIEAAREAIEAVYARAEQRDWPALQRVHGDYHLGQVILAPGRGWVLLDFEGEPIRPMAERTRPDLAIRDVAGMLRSFDYVAGSLRLEHPERPAEPVEEWASAARSSFLEGYVEASGADPVVLQPLLAALELDKAVYEAVYEARNRPDWIAIPLDAIRRLTA